MTNLGEIRSVDWQPKLGEIGSVVEGFDDVNQCIRIILAASKGSVPHRPEFGSDIWRYIDHPSNEAIPNIIREAVDAINIWEPRVDIRRITVDMDISNVTLKVEWIMKDSGETGGVEVTV